MMRSALHLWAVLATAGIGACHKTPVEDPNATAVAATAALDDAAPAVAPVVSPSRCSPADKAFAIDEGGGTTDLEIGDAVPFSGGYAVGFVHRTAAGRVAAVALLGPDAVGPVRVVDLGATSGDAPPPRLAPRANELLAAAYPLSRGGPSGGARRDLALYAISSGAASGPLLTVAQQRDDSLAGDLACAGSAGLIAWDEATASSRGVVRAVTFSQDWRAGPTRDVSPPESDAELPRVVPNGAGFIVLWIARRPDPTGAVDASELEATGEARTYGWLEMIPVDEHGVATGPLRRLTPASGRVSAYDVQVLPNTTKHPALLVVARDDGEAVDGSGGALLRVRVTGDVVESPVAFQSDGLGRGAPTLVEGLGGRPPWLAWVGPREQVRLLPLDVSGAPSANPSAEEGMSEGRPLLALGSASGSAGQLLVATPLDGAAQLRVFQCAR
jgi:hypothetical protein